MVLNGAAAVKKLKTAGGQTGQTKVMQRFISNFIPINSYQKHLPGGDQHLPYLGQLTLLEQGEEEIWLCDAEDFTSCYNLFCLPPAWRKYTCFGKLVDEALLGGAPGKMVYPAMRVVPMGWLNTVSIAQAVARTLVFQELGVPESSEISKLEAIPAEDDLTVIYLHSFDQLRRLDLECAEALEGIASPRRKRFLEMCQRKGLPLNEGKRVVAATRGSLQGGELQGDLGWYKLAGDKQINLVGLGATLLALNVWREFDVRHFVGKAIFGMSFRRPLLSVFQEIFGFLNEVMAAGKAQKPSWGAMDEVIMTMALTCLMGTNLKASLDDETTCSDASPTGGGVAVAYAFRAEEETVLHDAAACWMCDGPFNEGFALDARPGVGWPFAFWSV